MAVSRNWANQKSFLRQTYNQEVDDWFDDVKQLPLDNSSARKNARKACFIEPEDSQNMALIKIMTFRFTVQQVHLRPDVYGVASEPYQESVTLRPQVHLFFTQDASAVTPDRRRMEGQISLRLVNETSATMTKAKAQTIANKIKQEFTTPNNFIWKKGKFKLVYQEPEFGLNLSILALNEAEGIQVIKKVVEIANSTYKEDLLRIIEPKRDSATNPSGTNLVYGKKRKKKRWRPTGNVRFRYALLSLDGMQNRITLVDTTSKYLDALIWA